MDDDGSSEGDFILASPIATFKVFGTDSSQQLPGCCSLKSYRQAAKRNEILRCLNEVRIPGDGDQRFRTIVIAIPG